MPATPDRDTLRLRAPDRRTPAEAVALARRELARRPAPTLADVSLAPADRALVSFRERYPAVAERFHAGVLWSAAHVPGQPRPGPARRPCGWCLARAWAKRRGGPALRVDPLGRLLLGDPCPESCQAALGWQPPRPKPKPKPRPRPAARSRPTTMSRTRTSTKAPTRHAPAGQDPAGRYAATVAAALPAHPPRPIAPDTQYNRAAAARLYRATRGARAFTPAGMGWPAPPPRKGRR
jgi:hypothetical protein